MSTIKDLISKRKQSAKKNEPKRKVAYGTTINVDYDNSPQVLNRPGFVWVKENSQNGGVFQCFNPSVKMAVGLPVIIARDPGSPSRRVIQSVDWDALAVAISSSSSGKALEVPNHHRDHEFITMFPGLDIVNVYSRAIVPLKMYPGSTALTICVVPGNYMVDKTSTYYAGLIDDDISGYIPATVGNTLSLLVFIDSATNLVGYLPGAEAALLFPAEPAVPDGDIGLGYIRLHQGMSGIISESDITNDPRPFISIAPGGAGGTPADTVSDETAFDIAPAAGAASDYSRADHTHGSPTSPVIPVPSDTVSDETAFDIAPAAGASANYSRADHTHGSPTAPVIPVPSDTVSDETAFDIAPAEGTAATYSRSDHTHGSPASPTIPTPADTVSDETAFDIAPGAGAAATFSRSDHTHGSPTSPVIPTPADTVSDETSFDITPAAGASATYSRSDHTHGTPATPVGAIPVFHGFYGGSGEVVLANEVNTHVHFTEVWDTDAYHDDSTNPERVTIPEGMGGYYLVTVEVTTPLPPHEGYLVTMVWDSADNTLMRSQFYILEHGDKSVSLSKIVLLPDHEYIRVMLYVSCEDGIDITDVQATIGLVGT